MSKKKADVLKNVDFLDRVRIIVFKGQPTREDPFPFRIEIESLDKAKQVVIDESEAKKMNEILTAKAQQFDPRDPRVQGYIQEFAGRLLSELYRNGLAELEEVSDAPADPYEAIRKQYRSN